MTEPDKPTQPLPETDGWDKDAKDHPKVRWLHRLFILAAILIVTSVVGYGWCYVRIERKKVEEEKGKLILENPSKLKLYLLPWIHPNLRYLILVNCQNLTDLPLMEKLHQLEIDDCLNLTDLPPIQKLDRLVINDCPKLTDLPPMEELTWLEIYNCSAFTGLPPVENLPDIEHLNVRGCPKIPQDHIDQYKKKFPNRKIMTGLAPHPLRFGTHKR